MQGSWQGDEKRGARVTVMRISHSLAKCKIDANYRRD